MNLRDLGRIGGGIVPKGLFLRSGKLSILTPDECDKLCKKHHIQCVIDLRTPVEAEEFPDLLPEGVKYLQIPLLKDATIGVTHETGSDAMTIIRNLRKHPEKLLEMVPDFKALYRKVVTDEYSRSQLDKVVSTLRENADKGICTLFHCTAGKDRTGIASMALLKSYGISNEEIIKDYMRTNRYAFWPTLKKCVGVALLTRSWSLVRTGYKSFMADRELIEIAIKHYDLTINRGSRGQAPAPGLGQVPVRMTRLSFIIHLLSFSIALTSCAPGRHERMQRELAALQAMNQADSVLTNDSLAKALADYFDRHGTANEQMEAHYLLGRTYADRGEAPAALAAYHDAIDRTGVGGDSSVGGDLKSPPTDCNYRQLCRVYAQMAKIFYQQNLLKENLECLDKYLVYAWEAGDTLSAINAYAHWIPTFERLQMQDSIIHVGDVLYEQFYKGENCNAGKRCLLQRRIVSRYFAAVIPTLLDKGMKEKARHFIEIYERESGYFDSLGNIERGREAFYNCKARYFEADNRLDSAEYYLRKELTSGKDYMNQNMASKYLSRLFLKMNKADSAAKYALYSYDMNDSVYARMAMAEVEKVQNMYNYTRHKEQAILEKERADKESARFRDLSIIFICTGAFCLYYFWRKKKKLEAERKEYEESKRMLRKLQEEKENLQAVAANYANERIKDNEQLNDIITKKADEIRMLEEKLSRYSMYVAENTVEMHYKASGLYESLEHKLKRGMKMSDKDLADLDRLAQEYMPGLYAFLLSKGVTDEKKLRTCYLFRLHLSVKDVSNLLGMTSSYISQISKDLVSSLFSYSGSSKELKKEMEKFDSNGISATT